MAIGSFFSISLDPPLVGFCAGKGSSTWPKLREAGKFCVTILGDDQEEISRRFASKEADKFAGLAWDNSPLGSPRLGGALAWIDCETKDVHRRRRPRDRGRRGPRPRTSPTEGHPLVFFRGGYSHLA